LIKQEIDVKKKALFLLIIIYLAFVALGLPDAILGSGWNLIREDLNLSLGTLGIMSSMVCAFSIIATYNSPRLLKLLETKVITIISITLTGLALVSIAFVKEFYQMVILAIPLGIGAGAIDVSLNNYLTKHYKAHHMNYLHSFYGLGVTLGPSVMAYTLTSNSWRSAYLIVGGIILVIALFVLSSFLLWDKEDKTIREEEHLHINLKTMFSNPKSLQSIMIFLLYVHIESLMGVWIASYFFIVKSVSYSTAALFTTAYFLSFTLGRIFSGILSHRINPKHLVFTGEIIMVIGAILLVLNIIDNLYVQFGLVVIIGLGCAPIFPNMMYLNNEVFERNQISKMISLQMAIGYIGVGLLTPLAGLVFDKTTIKIFPIFVLAVSVMLLILTFSYLFKVKENNL